MNIQELIQYIELNIKANGVKSITGTILQQILVEICENIPPSEVSKPLKISDPLPVEDGIYLALESGTYSNGITVDLNEGITYLVLNEEVWSKTVYPINLTPGGIVEEGNTNAVSGGEVYDYTLPVMKDIDVTVEKTHGLLQGGMVPGNPFTNIYIANKHFDNYIDRINFRAASSGVIEILLLSPNGLNYDVSVISKVVNVGDNYHSLKQNFTGKIGVRCITAKFFMDQVNGSGLSSMPLPAIDPTPSTIPKSTADANNLPTWDISCVVYYEGIQKENEIIYRLDSLEKNQTSELPKIKIFAIGDSITSLSQGYTYISRVANWLNSEEYTNVAIGGATWAYRAGTIATDNPINTDDTNVVPNQVRKLLKIFSDGLITKPDLIVLSAGINDVARGHSLGDIITEFAKPLEDVNMHTIVGAIRWSIATLMQAFPDVRIVVLTPLLTSVVQRRYELTLPYANKIKEVSARLAVPVIDCFSESLINEVNQNRYMQTDMLHPNSLGQEMQALYVFKKLKSIYYNL